MGAPEAAVDAAHMYLRGDQLGLPGGTQRERAVKLYRQVRERERPLTHKDTSIRFGVGSGHFQLSLKEHH